jgi:hypothetical protein
MLDQPKARGSNKRTLLIVGINVCYVPKADISIRRRTDS